MVDVTLMQLAEHTGNTFLDSQQITFLDLRINE